jgi:hypothetical protein
MTWRRLGVPARALAMTALAGSAMTLASCLDLPSDRVWTSTHFRYHTREDDERVCRDILTVLEEHGEVVHAALGMSWDPGEVVDYYKFSDLDDFNDNASCGGGAACTDGQSVRSPGGFDRHELIHAYLAKLGFPPWLMIEGSAVAIACQLNFYPRPTVGWREAFETERTSSVVYGSGGWLVSRLLATRDPALFVRLYETVPNDADADEFAGVFQYIYGESLDDVWNETVAAEGGTVFCPWECSRPAIPLDGSGAVLDGVCGQAWGSRTFSVGAATDIVWSGAEDVTFDVRSCDRAESLGAWAGGYNPTPSFTALIPTSAGNHFIEYDASSVGDGVTLSARASEAPFVTTDCASAPPLMVDPTSAFVQVFFPPSDVATAIHLALAGPQSMSWEATRAAEQSAVSLCGACASTPGSCVPLSTEAPDVTLGPDSVLVAQPGPGALVSFRKP